MKLNSCSSWKSDRGSTEFDASSERSKRRKTEKLRASHSVSELAYTTQMSLRASGATQASSVLKDVTTKSPSRASRYQAAFQESQKPPPCEISADLALNLIISGKMTKETYKLMRNLTNANRGTSVYPSYTKILSAKRRCYPDSSAMTVTETSAEVKLQALLDHTSERLLQVMYKDDNELHPGNFENLQLILKWGCDGASSQEYKQMFSEKDSSDANVFFTSTVPLQLSVVNENHADIILWQNPRPSSPRFCRPIRLQFVKECVHSTREEQKYIENQIRSLLPFHTVIDGKNIEIKYKLVFTMIDGKVKNAITETDSSMRCYICKSTSKQFNNIDLVLKQKVDANNLCFGISSLHAWIRIMEWFLHLAYKCGDEMEKKWQARSAEQKRKVAARKQQIQNDFKQLYGLRIDIPKAGSGTTNDGNTARRFFENVSSTAEILGVDEEIIAKSKVMLQAILSGIGIDTEKFKVYCLNLAKRYVELYPWYPMPTSVHVILIHGYAIIEASPLPIGRLSEDAQEARNKDIRRYRENFSRKYSREKTMQDVFYRLLASSDPIISSLQNYELKAGKPLPPEVSDLLFHTPTSAEFSVDVENDSATTDDDEILSDYDF